MPTLAELANLAMTIGMPIMMLGFGLQLDGKQFRPVLKDYPSVLAAVVGPILLVPLLAFLIAHTLSLPAAILGAILLLAASPIGDIISLYTTIVRAQVAASTTFNILSCIIAAVTMPLVLAQFALLDGRIFEATLSISAIAFRVFITTSIPVIIGVCIRLWRPRIADRLFPTISNLSILIILVIVVLVALDNHRIIRQQWQAYLLGAGALLLSTSILGMIVAGLRRTVFGRAAPIALAFPVRNIGLAMMVSVSVLGRPEFLGAMLVYFILEVPILLAGAFYFRWRSGAAAPPVPAPAPVNSSPDPP